MMINRDLSFLYGITHISFYRIIRVIIMRKTIQKKRNTISAKAKVITDGAVKAVLVTAAVMLGMKWLGDVMEIVSNHVSVGAGMFVVFAVVCFFIHMDTKNSIEQAEEHESMLFNER